MWQRWWGGGGGRAGGADGGIDVGGGVEGWREGGDEGGSGRVEFGRVRFGVGGEKGSKAVKQVEREGGGREGGKGAEGGGQRCEQGDSSTAASRDFGSCPALSGS